MRWPGLVRWTVVLLLVSSVALTQPITGGGVRPSGVPAANQVALWATSSSIKGDSNLTWDPTNKKITVAGTAGGATVFSFPFQSQLVSGSGSVAYSAVNHWSFNSPVDAFGSITATQSTATIGTNGWTNNFTLSGATTTNPVTFTASGSDSTVGINLVPKSTGTVQNNGDPIVAVHHAQTTAQVSMEFGTAAASANALAVTFSAAFSSAPSCTCADNNATPAACGISVAASTSGVTFKGTTGATDNVSWVCVGLR